MATALAHSVNVVAIPVAWHLQVVAASRLELYFAGGLVHQLVVDTVMRSGFSVGLEPRDVGIAMWPAACSRVYISHLTRSI